MFGRKIAGAAALVGALQLVAKSLDLLALVVLARLLTPADFGLVAIAVSVLLIANSVTELPVLDVLVQRPEISDRDIETAFTLAALRGLLVAAVIVATSWPMAWLYDDIRLVPILCVVALAPVFQGLSSPAMVNFTRRIDYGPNAWSTIIGKGISLAVSLAIALSTGSYWALIAGLVAMQAATTVCTHILAPWRPRLGLEGTRAILGFTGWVTLSRIIWTISMQADRMLVGRVLGKTSLGHYSMAGDIASVATYAIAGPILGPIFAGFSRINNDIPRLRQAYMKSQQTLVMVVLPFGVGLAAIAANLIPALLGADWQATVPVICWLAPVIALQMMSVPVQAVAMALGMPKTLAVREGIGLAIRLPITLVAAIYFGLVGAAVARSLTGIVIIFVNLAIVRGILALPVSAQLLNVWRSLCGAAAMAAVLVGIDILAGAALGSKVIVLAVQVPVGALVYVTTHMVLWQVAGRPDGGERFLVELVSRRGAQA